TTEVMQLREFLPKVVNGDLIEMLQKALKERLGQEQEQLRQECLHLRSRLDEKLVLREQLWESREQLQQQAEFCTGTSSKEEAVKDILGKLQSFLSVAGQTLESFVKSLDGEAKAEQQDSNSHEQQFVLALAGVVTSECAACHPNCLLNLFQSMLMLMALYNVSINGDSEVCLHALRLLQSVLLEEALVGPGLLLDDPLLPLERIRTLATSSRHPALRQTAQETLDDLGSLQPHNCT
uniref:Heat shock transcription factor 2 binding protein n=1 Tax=Oncorhynchus tshawytscha TaxID=74940 RepID=A0A8C8F3D4_ONCTS